MAETALKREKTTALQLTMATACLLWSVTGVSASIGAESGRSLWLAWLLALAVAAPVYALLPRCCGKQPAGRAGAVLLALYALLAAAVCLCGAIFLWSEWTQTRAPFFVYAAVLALLIGYGVARGRLAALRLCVLLAAILALLAVVDSLLLLPQMELARLSYHPGRQSAYILPVMLRLLLTLLLPLPFVIVLSRQARAQLDAGRAQRAVWRGFCLGAAYLLLVAVRNVLILGDLLILDHYPLLRSLKMVEINVGLSRLEYFGMLALLAVVLGAAMVVIGQASASLRRLVTLPENKAAWLLTALLFAALLLAARWLPLF